MPTLNFSSKGDANLSRSAGRAQEDDRVRVVGQGGAANTQRSVRTRSQAIAMVPAAGGVALEEGSDLALVVSSCRTWEADRGYASDNTADRTKVPPRLKKAC